MKSTNGWMSAPIWMLVSISSFIGLMIGVRQLTASMSIFEMLALRSVIAFFILLLFVRKFTAPKVRTGKFSLHLGRNIAHFFGQYFWVWGIALLPLAEVIAIEFTSPILSVLLASIIFHEKLTRGRLLVLAAGFAGVLIIVRPGFEEISLGTAVVLAATVGFSATTLISKKLTHTESVWTILIYMSVLQFFIGIGPALANWVWPQGMDYFWLLVIGICGMTAHLGLTKALSLADAASILPMDYLRLPATFVIGYLLYNESMDWLVLMGASIIILGNYFHLRNEARMKNRIATPDHAA